MKAYMCNFRCFMRVCVQFDGSEVPAGHQLTEMTCLKLRAAVAHHKTTFKGTVEFSRSSNKNLKVHTLGLSHVTADKE